MAAVSRWEKLLSGRRISIHERRDAENNGREQYLMIYFLDRGRGYLPLGLESLFSTVYMRSP